jgi:hypothetical protein
MVVRQRRSTTRMRREYVSRWRGRKTRINNERNLVRIIYIFLSVPEASDCNLSCFGTLRDWFQFQTLVGHPSHRAHVVANRANCIYTVSWHNAQRKEYKSVN